MLDDALVRINVVITGIFVTYVSILVVLDDALVLIGYRPLYSLKSSLNPCCAGRCSSTSCSTEQDSRMAAVSILVVLDDALVPVHSTYDHMYISVSILVVLDDALVLEKQRLY